MDLKAWKDRLKNWNEFLTWEQQTLPSSGNTHALKVTGEWVDFFLKRHPRKPECPDTSGIEKLHQSLKFLSSLE